MDRLNKELKGLYTIALVNVVIWAIGIIALVFVLQKCPGAKGMFVILAGGVAVGIQIITRISNLKKAKN